MGQFYMVHFNSCYTIDLSFLSKYEVRNEYERYGGTIIFFRKQNNKTNNISIWK